MDNFLKTLNQVTASQQQAKPRNTEDDKRALFDTEERVAGRALYCKIVGTPLEHDFITPDHFEHGIFKQIYRVCKEAEANNDRVSFEDLRFNGLFDSEWETQENLRNLAKRSQQANDPITLSFAYDMDERYRVKNIKNALQQALDSIGEHKAFPQLRKTLDDMRVKIDDQTYTQTQSKKDFEHVEALDDFLHEYTDTEKTAISTGLDNLDALIGGFRAGELIVIGGRPGMGKTALSMHFACVAQEAGKNVLNFSFEMSNSQNMARFAARHAFTRNIDRGINYTDITRRQISAETMQKIVKSMKEDKATIKHHYDSTLSADKIFTYAEKHAYDLQRNGKSLDLIIVDYLQIIKMLGTQQAHIEIGIVTGRLKELSKHLGVPVILLSQLNRSLEGAQGTIEEKRPTLNHFRQSGKIEEDADIALFPFRPCYYEKSVDDDKKTYRSDYFEIIVAKNRQGENGITKQCAYMGKNFICDTDKNDDGLTAYGRSMGAYSGQPKGKKSIDI